MGHSNWDLPIPTKEGARSTLSNTLCKAGLENYVLKRSERPLLDQVA